MVPKLTFRSNLVPKLLVANIDCPSNIYRFDFGGEFEFLIKINRKENYEKQCNDENCQNYSDPDFFLCCRPLKKGSILVETF